MFACVHSKCVYVCVFTHTHTHLTVAVSVWFETFFLLCVCVCACVCVETRRPPETHTITDKGSHGVSSIRRSGYICIYIFPCALLIILLSKHLLNIIHLVTELFFHYLRGALCDSCFDFMSRASHYTQRYVLHSKHVPLCSIIPASHSATQYLELHTNLKKWLLENQTPPSWDNLYP